MDYKKHYNLLIDRAKNRNINGYVEKHHIIPKCMGGTNEKYNIVELTPEEHYVAHQLLVKIYPDNKLLIFAAHQMTISSKNMPRNNKRYGWLKRLYVEVCKTRTGENNPSYGKGWFYNPITLEEGKFLLKDVPNGWIKGRNTSKPRIKNKCKRCGNIICENPNICKNIQRINRFIKNFHFNENVIGTCLFYQEYYRVVNKLKNEYLYEKLSVEELKVKYGINTNETMRRILKSLDIDRRSQKEALCNYNNKSGE